MIGRERFYAPQHKDGSKELIVSHAEGAATSVDLLRLRLEGVLEDIKGELTGETDRGASKRLYLAATAIGKVVEYLADRAEATSAGTGAAHDG